MTRTDTPRAAPRVEPPPALAVVARRARALLEHERGDLAPLAAVVEIDPALTGSILRVVRCPLYAVRHADLSIQRCVEMIGHRVLHRVLTSLPQATDTRADDIERACRQWLHGLAVAAAARWLSNQGGFEAPEEAYLVGLVHRAGRMAAPWGEDSLQSSLRTEAIVRSWRLGPRAEAVARWHHALVEGVSVDSLVVDGGALDPATRRLLVLVARASALASSLDYGADGETTDLSIAEDPDAPAVREAIELELAHAADVLGLPPTAPADFLAVLAAHEARARREETATAPLANEARSALRVAAIHRQVIEPHGMTSIADMLDRGLRLIHEDMEFDRLLLLEVDPVRPQVLRSRFVLDPTHIDFERGLSGVELPAGRASALSRALETELPECALDPMLEPATMERLGVTSFAAVPLRAGQATMGVVVADQFFSDRPVTESDTAMLAMLCSALGLAMENAALDGASRKLRALAEKDELTGINNRRNILAVLQREIDRARRYGKPLSLAMIDVDHFKNWNDAHGHQIGDTVLAAVAQLISSVSREIDSYGRYGGEEFLIVLPETQVEHAVLYAERLRTTIEAHGESLRQRYPGASLSVSIGVASMSPRGDDADKMIQRADAALYAAKEHGRNRVCVELPVNDAGKPPNPPHSRGLLDEL